MSWHLSFESPQGESILDAEYEVSGTADDDGVNAALLAADAMVPNSEDGAQRVHLSGDRSSYETHELVSVSASVTILREQADADGSA